MHEDGSITQPSAVLVAYNKPDISKLQAV